jgi:hypothetical protein
VSWFAADVASEIRSEVEKIAREEADDAWMAPSGAWGAGRVDPRRNLGGGI